MSDLISRQDAIDVILKETYADGAYGYADAKSLVDVLEQLPSAEPKTGEWVWSKDNASWCCGTCGCVFEEIDWKPEYNFCPNCGADMRGKQE